MVNVFAVPVYFVVFRETLETSVIVSVLLAFLKQSLGGQNHDRVLYKKLVKQVWLGTGLGLLICLIIGGGFIGAFYSLGQDLWSDSEDIWEGAFSVVATIVISIMGGAILRVSKMQDKWRVKLSKALEKTAPSGLNRRGRFKLWCERYVMFMLPFITVLREGLEAVVFVTGVSFSNPPGAFPLPVVAGLATGCLIGLFICKGGSHVSIQIFLIISTCFLYLVAAGLFSKAIWDFEINAWNGILGGDASAIGSDPGSYDITQSVWHVNCCNPEINGGGGWGIFNAILGWENSATYGSVLSYNAYWLLVIACYGVMIFYERCGRWPFMKAKVSLPSPQDDVEGGPRGDEEVSLGSHLSLPALDAIIVEAAAAGRRSSSNKNTDGIELEEKGAGVHVASTAAPSTASSIPRKDDTVVSETPIRSPDSSASSS